MAGLDLTKPCTYHGNKPDKNGYVSVGGYYPGRETKVHRIEWVKHYGPIPRGWVVLQECGDRACRTIEHLVCVPRGSKAAPAEGADWSTCSHGHERTPQNIILDGPWKVCRMCRLLTEQRELARKRAAEWGLSDPFR